MGFIGLHSWIASPGPQLSSLSPPLWAHAARVLALCDGMEAGSVV